MTKRLIYAFLVGGAFSVSCLFSFVTSGSLGRDITSCTFDQVQGVFYGTTEAAVGQPGIITASAPVGSNAPVVSAFNLNSIGLGFKNIVMVSPATVAVPTTIAALVDSGNGLFDRFVVTNSVQYAMSGIVKDSPTDGSSPYGVNPSGYGLYGPYGAYTSYGYSSYQSYTPYGYGYVYPDSINDSEILNIAASSDTIFTVAHRIYNDFLSAGTALNAHKVTITPTAITIDNDGSFQKTVDSRDFLVGMNPGQIFDVSNTVSLCYNDDLEALYCAPSWITGDTTGVRSVAAYHYDKNAFTLSTLPLHATANSDTSSWLSGSSASTQNIIGILGSEQTLSVHQLGVMGTSSGKYYLIVMGGHGYAYQTGDKVYALPLVVPGNTDTGALANVLDVTHTTQAEDSSQLYTAASIPAVVGGGKLPWEAGVNNYNMVVLQDTVYVSIDNSAATNPGIYYSQARFDHNGNINGWSSWSLATPRALGSVAGNGANQGAVSMFAVNTVSSKIWAVPSDQLDRINLPSWTQPTMSRARSVRDDIPHSRLLLPITNVDDFGNLSPQENLFNTLQSININTSWSVKDTTGAHVLLSAYIGTGSDGVRKLIIIRAGVDDSIANEENYAIISLPTQDPILSIGFLQSPLPGAPTGILLVGTQTALYAYLDPINHQGGRVISAGANQANLHDLSLEYWTDSQWEQVLPDIFNGNISSIDALYNDLYILQRSKDLGGNDQIYRISVNDIEANTVHLATPVLVFESDSRSNVLPYILNHLVLPASDDNALEQLLIGSFDKAFILKAIGGIQAVLNSISLSAIAIYGTEGQKTLNLLRDSDNQFKILGQGADNKIENKNIYVAVTSDGAATTSVTSSTTIVPSAGSTGQQTTGSQTWTDGARKLTIAANALISQEGGSLQKRISTLESEAFSNKKLSAISIVGGIITVQTTSGAIYLK